MTRRMYDAAYPPANPPKWEVVAAYIGGDTPHVWTDAEWAAQPARWRLPIYVRSNPGSHDPHTDAASAIAWLRSRGVPRGCAVSLDLETAVNKTYVRAFDAAIVAAGYVTVGYGSVSTIFSNPETSGGVWAAHYTGTPHMEPGSVATQWANDRILGADYDASLIDDSVPLWDTEGPQPQEGDVATVSSVGAEGVNQTIPAGKGAALTINKVYDDPHKLRSGNVVKPGGYFEAHVTTRMELSGLTPGGKVRISWARMSADGKTRQSDAHWLPFRADEAGKVVVGLPWQMEVTSTMSIAVWIYNDDSKPLTVDSAVVKVDLFEVK